MPSNVLDMSYDDQGNLNWILIREWYRDDEDPFANTTNDLMARYRLWTRNDWYLLESKENDGTFDSAASSTNVKEIDSGVHGLGIVPVTYCDHNESSEYYVTPALVSDIAYLDRAVANYLSNIDVIIQDQTFSQLVMPAQALEAGKSNDDQLRDIGTKQIFTYDGEGGEKPFFLVTGCKAGSVYNGCNPENYKRDLPYYRYGW